MYVAQSDACTTLPNGLIVPTPAQVAARQAVRARMEQSITTAQKAIDSVTTRPDMGPVVTTPARYSAGSNLSNWPAGPDLAKPGGGSYYCSRASVPVAVRAGTSIETYPKQPPLTTRNLDHPVAAPSTGNPCLDVQIGYALQSQLSKAMLWKCTQAGYFKTALRPTVPAVLTLANQNALPNLPDADVPPYDPSMLGMGDVTGGPGSFAFWSALGLAGSTLWLAWQWAKGHR